MNILKRAFWALYRLFPRGRREWILKQGFEGLKKSSISRRETKLKVIHSANKMIKSKKILGFGKNGSVVKSKKTDHEIIEGVKHRHSDELQERGIKITKSGKLKNA